MTFRASSAYLMILFLQDGWHQMNDNSQMPVSSEIQLGAPLVPVHLQSEVFSKPQRTQNCGFSPLCNICILRPTVSRISSRLPSKLLDTIELSLWCSPVHLTLSLASLPSIGHGNPDDSMKEPGTSQPPSVLQYLALCLGVPHLILGWNISPWSLSQLVLMLSTLLFLVGSQLRAVRQKRRRLLH